MFFISSYQILSIFFLSSSFLEGERNEKNQSLLLINTHLDQKIEKDVMFESTLM